MFCLSTVAKLITNRNFKILRAFYLQEHGALRPGNTELNNKQSTTKEKDIFACNNRTKYIICKCIDMSIS